MTPLRFLDATEVGEMRRGYLVTVNMQHLYAAYETPALREVFFHSPMASLCLDGRGAQSLLQARQKQALPVVAGNEALDAALRKAVDKRVLVIGTSDDAVQGTSDCHPAVAFRHLGGRFDIRDRATAEQAAAAVVSAVEGDGPFAFVAIALGVGKQELLAEALASTIDAPMYCIGGSFEMLAGALARAPGPVQRAGLEAVWRLALQPNRARLNRLIKSYGYYALFRLGVLNIERVLERRLP